MQIYVIYKYIIKYYIFYIILYIYIYIQNQDNVVHLTKEEASTLDFISLLITTAEDFCFTKGRVGTRHFK